MAYTDDGTGKALLCATGFFALTGSFFAYLGKGIQESVDHDSMKPETEQSLIITGIILFATLGSIACCVYCGHAEGNSSSDDRVTTIFDHVDNTIPVVIVPTEPQPTRAL